MRETLYFFSRPKKIKTTIFLVRKFLNWIVFHLKYLHFACIFSKLFFSGLFFAFFSISLSLNLTQTLTHTPQNICNTLDWAGPCVIHQRYIQKAQVTEKRDMFSWRSNAMNRCQIFLFEIFVHVFRIYLPYM